MPLGGSTRPGEGKRTSLFGYGIRPSGPTLTGYPGGSAFAAIALATTGLSPGNDRIIELAVVRTDLNGRVTHRWDTLLAPGTAPGLVGLHGVTADEAEGAPAFVDVAGQLMYLLSDAVAVAQHAEYVEEFLLTEFLRAGLLPPSVPAVSARRLAQATVAANNHRLGTLAAQLRLPHQPDGSALAAAETLADAIPALLTPHAGALVYPVPPLPSLPTPPGVPAGRPRQTPLPAPAADPWLTGLFRSMSPSAGEMHDPRVAVYMESLSSPCSREGT